MSGSRRLRTQVSFAWAGLALILALSARAESAPIRLVAPQEEATLLAGSSAELEWAPLGPLEGVEEWEAFLSLDGGATYPIRITPHLDRDLRRVRWQVPGIPTSQARLLLCFGDERRELYLELPQRFAIAAAPGAEWAFALASVAQAPGEPALPGHVGVIAWVEGSRRGGSLRQVVAPARPALRGTFSLAEGHPSTAVLGLRTSVDPPAPARRNAGGALVAGRGAPRGELGPAPRPSFDILLQTQRQNE